MFYRVVHYLQLQTVQQQKQKKKVAFKSTKNIGESILENQL